MTVCREKTNFSLLGPLPSGVGQYKREEMAGEPFAGWAQVRLSLDDEHGTMRVVVGLFDPQGRPGAISDLVATESGVTQESIGGRVEQDGRIDGTHWATEGDRHAPRPLTDEERAGLLALAEALSRYDDVGKQR